MPELTIKINGRTLEIETPETIQCKEIHNLTLTDVANLMACHADAGWVRLLGNHYRLVHDHA